MPGNSVGSVARKYDISRSQIYQWRRAFRSGTLCPESLAVVDFLPVEVCDEGEDEEPVVDERPSPDMMISIELRHERTVRIPSDLPCGQIRRLIA
ncbi:MAG: transposase, partial [Geminicoccales bacterium]